MPRGALRPNTSDVIDCVLRCVAPGRLRDAFTDGLLSAYTKLRQSNAVAVLNLATRVFLIPLL